LGEERVWGVENRYSDWLPGIHLLPNGIDVPEEFLDAFPNLLAFNSKLITFHRQEFDFTGKVLLLLSEALNELNGLEDTFLKAG
jgi:hypothetical protein